MKTRKMILIVILTALVAGIATLFAIKIAVSNNQSKNNTTNNENNTAETEVVDDSKIDDEKLAFQEVSEEECDKLWNSIKISMSDIPEVYWEFDFWEKGFYKEIPDEGRYNICLYGMEDVNGHINEAALYLITTIPSAHNNVEVISDVQNYRKKQIESHNGMESKITFACDNVIDILQQTDKKKDWNISNTFWVKSGNDIAGASFDGYAYSESYEIPKTDDYILNFDILNDNYIEQKVLGVFNFESGNIEILNKTKEKELISMLDDTIFNQHNLTTEEVSLVYWYNSDIEWLSNSVFEFSYMPYECNCDEQCKLSFRYDLNNDNVNNVSLVLDKCSMSRYQD